MGDTIPNCEFMHAHEEIIEKVNASMLMKNFCTILRSCIKCLETAQG